MKENVNTLKNYAQNTISDCDEIRYKAQKSRGYIVDALDCFAESASSGSIEEELNIFSIDAVLQAANTLENMKERSENFACESREKVREFEMTMGDLIAGQALVIGEEISEKIEQATSSFSEKADYLKSAYEKLLAYLKSY